MPVCTVHLLSLASSVGEFAARLQASVPTKPLVVARVVRWMITPTRVAVDPLLGQQPLWDLLVITAGAEGLPASLLEDKRSVQAVYAVRAGIPSALTTDFAAKNERLLHPSRPEEVPPLTGALDGPRVASSAQNLEYTAELGEWVPRWDPDRRRGAVSMLNLLKFVPGKHADYLQYGKAFAESVGSRRGGAAKLVGRVVPDTRAGAEQEQWDEIALAHYPSIRHFADMAASKDYQEVNHRFRVGSLSDTCILCTSELDPELLSAGAEKQRL